MHVVAIGSDRICDGDGEPLDPVALVREVGEGDAVLLHDLAAVVSTATAEELVGEFGGDVDVITGAWTFVDDRHGVVERRGVLTMEHLRWANTVGPAIIVTGRTLRSCGWAGDGHAGFHDLLLRLAESSAEDALRVESVPTVLAHLATVGPGAGGVREAVERHLERTGVDARVVDGDDLEPSVVVDRALPDGVTASLVVPTTGRLTDVRGRPARLVVNLLDSLFGRTEFPLDRFEVLLATGPEMAPGLPRVIGERFGDAPIRFVGDDEPFSHSRRTNRGVLAASGDVVVLLNDDTEVVSPDWLRQLVAVALEPGVGLVGPLLRYPDGTVQSAGHATSPHCG